MRAIRKYRTLYSKDKLEISRYFEYCLSECQSPFCSSPVRAKGTSPWQNAGFDLPGITIIRQQLAMLLGKKPKDIANIRKTSEVPPRVSVIDVTMAITGKNKNDAAQDFRRVIGSFPAVEANCVNWKVPGARQRDTPVTDARGIVEIIMLMSGRQDPRRPEGKARQGRILPITARGAIP